MSDEDYIDFDDEYELAAAARGDYGQDLQVQALEYMGVEVDVGDQAEPEPDYAYAPNPQEEALNQWRGAMEQEFLRYENHLGRPIKPAEEIEIVNEAAPAGDVPDLVSDYEQSIDERFSSSDREERLDAMAEMYENDKERLELAEAGYPGTESPAGEEEN